MKRLTYSILVSLALSMSGIANAQTELPTDSISSSKEEKNRLYDEPGA